MMSVNEAAAAPPPQLLRVAGALVGRRLGLISLVPCQASLSLSPPGLLPLDDAVE